MNDRQDAANFLRSTSPKPTPASGPRAREKPSEEEAGEEEFCPAFGYLRGIRERALAVEFRYRNGNSEFFPYSWLGPWRFNPSSGLLLKFTGDVTTLVLIRGSNLDAMVNQGVVNLIEHGFQRHRILWVREMDEQELRQVGERGPTIDRIDIAEFESQEEVREWLIQTAPAFVRAAR
jgi:hypothetical protein